MLKRAIQIVEVGVRDGLQNEKIIVDTGVKYQLIKKLADTGLKTIEVTSFVSPKRVPQMADSAELFRLASKDYINSINLPVLVPNLKGLEQASQAGAREIALFVAASESFSEKNISCSIEESLLKAKEVAGKAHEKGMRVRGYVSCIIGCPFEGWIEPAKVLPIVKHLLDECGCYQVSLGDTIGVGTPGHVRTLLDHVSSKIPVDTGKIAMHCHDTYGQALANILLSVQQYGITTIDSAVAGLGGCPFAPGATGNVATEDVVYMLRGLGYETSVDLDKLLVAGQYICSAMGRPNASKTATALINKTKLYQYSYA